ncbi:MULTISPECIES: Hsp20/alpha crystallin family protein [Streptomyces]|uniref:Hsp20/alpha crystallin family protein n=1 Tax=Streptomyces TaxID=1883 RepID=UPI002248F789|nr:Hsp20/alpha crystallin family protein [Streptomyces sp. JHD 1]MCX2968073.1 Hsp20/alpha crystallin family protein [Streptomyces sp. JHD 1]
MLMRTDPFRELDRITQQFLSPSGTWTKPSAMPMDAYRDGDTYVIAVDLPGVAPDAIDLDVERNMLTVKAERRPTAHGDHVERELSERPLGVFSRQVMLADTLDTEHIDAHYENGVLTVRIPISERARARRIPVGTTPRKQIGG